MNTKALMEKLAREFPASEIAEGHKCRLTGSPVVMVSHGHITVFVRTARFPMDAEEFKQTFAPIVKEIEMEKKQNELALTYPLLCFDFPYDDSEPCAIWVRRTGANGKPRDAEALGQDIPLSNTKRLREVSVQLADTINNGGFWCASCKQAHPQEEYGYFYFSTIFCKKCTAENPQWLRAAKAERYN